MRRTSVTMLIAMASLSAGLASSSSVAWTAAADPGPSGATVRQDSVYFDEMPEAIMKVAPEYPDDARRARVWGTVMLKALVGRDGRVEDVHIHSSVPMLDRAAMEGVRQWRFRPARSKGAPLAVWVLIPVNFRPDEDWKVRWVPLELSHVPVPAGASGRPVWPREWDLGGLELMLADTTRADSLPRVIHRIEPLWEFDDYARAAKIAGFLVVKARVGSDGTVSDATIAKSVTKLDRAALIAIRQWRFRPAIRAGQHVPVTVYIPLHFQAR